MEYWSFEAIVILSGLLPNPKLETSTMSTCLNTSTTLYMITFGIGAAVSTRVSNELGAGGPVATKMAIYIALVIATVEGLILGAAIILLRNIWGQAVNRDEEVISYVASLMPFIAVVHFIDAYQCVFAGIVRGCGWQKICAIVNLGSFYGIGLPISILLAFKQHLGGKGLWAGIIGALLVQVLSLGTVSSMCNWDKEARKTLERVQRLAPLKDVLDQNLSHDYNNDLGSKELESGRHHDNKSLDRQ